MSCLPRRPSKDLSPAVISQLYSLPAGVRGTRRTQSSKPAALPQPEWFPSYRFYQRGGFSALLEQTILEVKTESPRPGPAPSEWLGGHLPPVPQPLKDPSGNQQGSGAC